jgi:alpha-ribazole phosphatase
MKLWLVRHPQPDVPTGLCYGISDVPVVESHLDELVERLPQHLPRDAALWSSPLSRCLRLAQGLEAQGFGPLRTDERLREMNFGRWEGTVWSQLPRHEVDAWRADIEHHIPPGGESLGTLARRGLEFVSHLPPEREAILVTHAGVILTLLKGLRGLPMSGFSGHRVDYGQVLVLQRDAQGWTLLDDTQPVSGEPPTRES